MGEHEFVIEVDEASQRAGGGSYVVQFVARIEVLDLPDVFTVQMLSVCPPDAEHDLVEIGRQMIEEGAREAFAGTGKGAALRVRDFVIHFVDFEPHRVREFAVREIKAALNTLKAENDARMSLQKIFVERRDRFLASLREIVGDCKVESWIVDSRSGYESFREWREGQWLIRTPGVLRNAEQFLCYMIDQGHHVAYAVQKEGGIVRVCVSFDGDWLVGKPVWPADFRVDFSKVWDQTMEVGRLQMRESTG